MHIYIYGEPYETIFVVYTLFCPPGKYYMSSAASTQNTGAAPLAISMMLKYDVVKNKPIWSKCSKYWNLTRLVALQRRTFI